MKRRTKIILALAILAILATTLAVFPRNKARAAATKTRRTLREQGFKTELTEFDGLIPAEVQARADIIIRAGQAAANDFSIRGPEIMRPIGSNAAVVLATAEPLTNDFGVDFWLLLSTNLARNDHLLDEACAAILSGPIRFDPAQPQSGRGPTGAPAYQRALSSALAARVLLDLRTDNHAAARTNLLAVTRLGTAWNVEPREMSYLVRFYCVALAERVTWEALQASKWPEHELLALQREWQGPDFFAGLTEAVAFSRAFFLSQCSQAREQPSGPSPPLRQIGSDLVTSPSRGWAELTGGWRESRYRNYGSYEDENAVMIYSAERERELQRATNAACWAEMRSLPGATNLPAYHLPRDSRFQMPTLQRQPNSSAATFRQRQTLLSRAVETECRRRLVVAALALERFQRAHGAYPRSLEELVPDFLSIPPADFMDAKPLRYRPTADNHFVLYSVGLDCVDDGGQMRADTNSFSGPGRGFYRSEGPDLLWPRPASAEEIEAEAETPPQFPARGAGRRRLLN